MSTQHINKSTTIILRISILILTVVVGTWLTIKYNNLAAGILFGLLIVLQAGLFVHYFNRVNRKIAFFFDAVENNDSSLRFSTDVKNHSEQKLNRSLNRINSLIQQAKARNREQEQFYQSILEHVATGIIIHDEKGNVVQANSTAKKLLQLDQFTNLVQLKRVDNQLYEAFHSLSRQGRQSVKLQKNNKASELSLRSVTFTARNSQFRLVAVNDIQTELDEKESDAWIRLIRVLTHEIMNSIAPITSLSETLMNLFEKHTCASVLSDDALHTQALEGLEVIKERGDDLIGFVMRYRQLTRIPQPEKQKVHVAALLDKIRILSSTEPGFSATTFQIAVHPHDFSINADEKQLTHVLINLTKNALEALNGQPDGKIQIKAGRLDSGRAVISIQDNGPGIASDQLNQVFIPFFTTKEKGSGIGLSFSRQVIRLHGGNLQVQSKQGEGARFIIELPE